MTQQINETRLRYLFWLYLDWRQRAKILADVGAIPSMPEQAIPQTLERIVLKKADLYAVWQKMLPLIPDHEREKHLV